MKRAVGTVLVLGGTMNFVKGFFLFLMLPAGVLMATGSTPRGTGQAQTADHGTVSHGSSTTSGETTQAKISRAFSASPADMTKITRISDTHRPGKRPAIPERDN